MAKKSGQIEIFSELNVEKFLKKWANGQKKWANGHF